MWALQPSCLTACRSCGSSGAQHAGATYARTWRVGMHSGGPDRSHPKWGVRQICSDATTVRSVTRRPSRSHTTTTAAHARQGEQSRCDASPEAVRWAGRTCWTQAPGVTRRSQWCARNSVREHRRTLTTRTTQPCRSLAARDQEGADTIGHSAERDGAAGSVPAAAARTDTHPAEKLEAAVTIVGAGPVGLTLALLLGQLGVRSVVLDRELVPTDHPQAHFLHQSAVEVLRQLGLETTARAAAPPVADWSRFVYCGGMSGPMYGVDDHRARVATFDPPPESLSPCDVLHLAQNKLVGILRHEAQNNPLVNLIEGCAVHTVVQRSDSVRTEGVRAAASNRTAATVSVESQYVVGADGAASAVRDIAGFRLDRGPVLQHLLNVHFSAPSLRQKLCERGMLYFVYNRETVCVVVAHDVDAGEFVCQIPYFPPYEQPADFTPDECRRLVLAAVGGDVSPSDITVLSVKQWRMAGGTTDTYSTGRVHLVGDACHQFPPSGAFGMNTGIQDARNLAWKLAWAVCGTADVDAASLLDSYNVERRPVALDTLATSMANYQAVLDTGALLGADARHLDAVLGVASGRAASLLPAAARSTLVKNALKVGRAQFGLLNTGNAVGRTRLRRLGEALHRGRGLQLLFPAHDLGQVYKSTLVDTLPESHQHKGGHEAVATIRRGARLPHRAVCRQPGAMDDALTQTSTIDLVATLRVPELLLFVWGTPDQTFLDAVPVLRTKYTNLKLMVCGNSGSTEAPEGLSTVSGYLKWSGSGTGVTAADPWGDNGAVLVRPDNVVAWRHSDNPQHNGTADLETLLAHYYLPQEPLALV